MSVYSRLDYCKLLLNEDRQQKWTGLEETRTLLLVCCHIIVPTTHRFFVTGVGCQCGTASFPRQQCSHATHTHTHRVYLSRYLVQHVPQRTTCSAALPFVTVPRYNTAFTCRSFSSATSTVWNGLPADVVDAWLKCPQWEKSMRGHCRTMGRTVRRGRFSDVRRRLVERVLRGRAGADGSSRKCPITDCGKDWAT